MSSENTLFGCNHLVVPDGIIGASNSKWQEDKNGPFSPSDGIWPVTKCADSTNSTLPSIISGQCYHTTGPLPGVFQPNLGYLLSKETFPASSVNQTSTNALIKANTNKNVEEHLESFLGSVGANCECIAGKANLEWELDGVNITRSNIDAAAWGFKGSSYELDLFDPKTYPGRCYQSCVLYYSFPELRKHLRRGELTVELIDSLVGCGKYPMLNEVYLPNTFYVSSNGKVAHMKTSLNPDTVRFTKFIIGKIVGAERYNQYPINNIKHGFAVNSHVNGTVSLKHVPLDIKNNYNIDGGELYPNLTANYFTSRSTTTMQHDCYVFNPVTYPGYCYQASVLFVSFPELRRSLLSGDFPIDCFHHFFGDLEAYPFITDVFLPCSIVYFPKDEEKKYGHFAVMFGMKSKFIYRQINAEVGADLTDKAMEYSGLAIRVCLVILLTKRSNMQSILNILILIVMVHLPVYNLITSVIYGAALFNLSRVASFSPSLILLFAAFSLGVNVTTSIVFSENPLDLMNAFVMTPIYIVIILGIILNYAFMFAGKMGVYPRIFVTSFLVYACVSLEAYGLMLTILLLSGSCIKSIWHFICLFVCPLVICLTPYAMPHTLIANWNRVRNFEHLFRTGSQVLSDIYTLSDRVSPVVHYAIEGSQVTASHSYDILKYVYNENLENRIQYIGDRINSLPHLKDYVPTPLQVMESIDQVLFQSSELINSIQEKSLNFMSEGTHKLNSFIPTPLQVIESVDKAFTQGTELIMSTQEKSLSFMSKGTKQFNSLIHQVKNYSTAYSPLSVIISISDVSDAITDSVRPILDDMNKHFKNFNVSGPISESIKTCHNVLVNSASNAFHLVKRYLPTSPLEFIESVSDLVGSVNYELLEDTSSKYHYIIESTIICVDDIAQNSLMRLSDAKTNVGNYIHSYIRVISVIATPYLTIIDQEMDMFMENSKETGSTLIGVIEDLGDQLEQSANSILLTSMETGLTVAHFMGEVKDELEHSVNLYAGKGIILIDDFSSALDALRDSLNDASLFIESSFSELYNMIFTPTIIERTVAPILKVDLTYWAILVILWILVAIHQTRQSYVNLIIQSEKMYVIRVRSNITLTSLKKEIAKKTGIYPSVQILTIKTKILSSLMFPEVELRDDVCIFVSERMLGGMLSKSNVNDNYDLLNCDFTESPYQVSELYKAIFPEEDEKEYEVPQIYRTYTRQQFMTAFETGQRVMVTGIDERLEILVEINHKAWTVSDPHIEVSGPPHNPSFTASYKHVMLKSDVKKILIHLYRCVHYLTSSVSDPIISKSSEVITVERARSIERRGVWIDVESVGEYPCQFHYNSHSERGTIMIRGKADCASYVPSGFTPTRVGSMLVWDGIELSVALNNLQKIVDRYEYVLFKDSAHEFKVLVSIKFPITVDYGKSNANTNYVAPYLLSSTKKMITALGFNSPVHDGLHEVAVWRHSLMTSLCLEEKDNKYYYNPPRHFNGYCYTAVMVYTQTTDNKLRYRLLADLVSFDELIELSHDVKTQTHNKAYPINLTKFPKGAIITLAGKLQHIMTPVDVSEVIYELKDYNSNIPMGSDVKRRNYRSVGSKVDKPRYQVKPIPKQPNRKDGAMDKTLAVKNVNKKLKDASLYHTIALGGKGPAGPAAKCSLIKWGNITLYNPARPDKFCFHYALAGYLVETYEDDDSTEIYHLRYSLMNYLYAYDKDEEHMVFLIYLQEALDWLDCPVQLPKQGDKFLNFTTNTLIDFCANLPIPPTIKCYGKTNTQYSTTTSSHAIIVSTTHTHAYYDAEFLNNRPKSISQMCGLTSLVDLLGTSQAFPNAKRAREVLNDRLYMERCRLMDITNIHESPVMATTEEVGVVGSKYTSLSILGNYTSGLKLLWTDVEEDSPDFDRMHYIVHTTDPMHFELPTAGDLRDNCVLFMKNRAIEVHAPHDLTYYLTRAGEYKGLATNLKIAVFADAKSDDKKRNTFPANYLVPTTDDECVKTMANLIKDPQILLRVTAKLIKDVAKNAQEKKEKVDKTIKIANWSDIESESSVDTVVEVPDFALKPSSIGKKTGILFDEYDFPNKGVVDKKYTPGLNFKTLKYLLLQGLKDDIPIYPDPCDGPYMLMFICLALGSTIYIHACDNELEFTTRLEGNTYTMSLTSNHDLLVRKHQAIPNRLVNPHSVNINGIPYECLRSIPLSSNEKGRQSVLALFIRGNKVVRPIDPPLSHFIPSEAPEIVSAITEIAITSTKAAPVSLENVTRVGLTATLKPDLATIAYTMAKARELLQSSGEHRLTMELHSKKVRVFDPVYTARAREHMNDTKLWNLGEKNKPLCVYRRHYIDPNDIKTTRSGNPNLEMDGHKKVFSASTPNFIISIPWFVWIVLSATYVLLKVVSMFEDFTIKTLSRNQTALWFTVTATLYLMQTIKSWKYVFARNVSSFESVFIAGTTDEPVNQVLGPEAYYKEMKAPNKSVAKVSFYNRDGTETNWSNLIVDLHSKPNIRYVDYLKVSEGNGPKETIMASSDYNTISAFLCRQVASRAGFKNLTKYKAYLTAKYLTRIEAIDESKFVNPRQYNDQVLDPQKKKNYHLALDRVINGHRFRTTYTGMMKTNEKLLEKGRPRFLTNPPDELKSILGALNYSLLHALKNNFPEIVHGMNSEDLSKHIYDKFSRIQKKTYIMLDGSAFDSTQYADLIKLVDIPLISKHFDKWYQQSLLPQYLRDKVRKAALSTSTSINIRRQDKTIMCRCTLDGTVTSGDPLRTTLGNSLRSSSYIGYLLYEAGIDGEYLVAGDDVLICINNDDVERFKEALPLVYVKDTNSTGGLGQVCKFIHYDTTIATFLSKVIIPIPGGIINFRKPLRFVYTGNTVLKTKITKKYSMGAHKRNIMTSMNYMTSGLNFLKLLIVRLFPGLEPSGVKLDEYNSHYTSLDSANYEDFIKYVGGVGMNLIVEEPSQKTVSAVQPLLSLPFRG